MSYYWANAFQVSYSGGTASVDYSNPVSIHDPSQSAERRCVDGSLKLSAEEIDSFTFTLMADHPFFSEVTAYLWLVKVCYNDGSSNEVLFAGRVIGVETGMAEDGVIYKTVTCEGAKGYMQDTYVFIDNSSKVSQFDDGPMLCPTTVSAFANAAWRHTYYNDGTFKVPAGVLMQHAINRHNAQCESGLSGFGEDYKKITLVMSGDWRKYICYVDVEYDTGVWDYVSDLAEEAGAELVMTYDSNCNATLTVRDSGAYSGTAGTIALGDNMCSCASDLAPDELVTALHVWGDQLDVTSKTSGGIEYETGDRLSLATICNAGHNNTVNLTVGDYSGLAHADDSIIIYSKTGLAKYGAIHAAYAIDGIFDTDQLDSKYDGSVFALAAALKTNDVEKLVRRACRYLKRHCSVKPSVTVSALDLSLIGTDHAAFRVLERWAVKVQKGTGAAIVDDKLLVTELTINLDDPAASDVTLGRKRRRAMNMAVHSKVRAEKKSGKKRKEKSSQASKSSKYGSDGDSTSNGSGGYKHKVVASKPSSPSDKTIYFVTGE